jgi:methylated-DNA-protein-cysteine methyltransferase related protein
MPHAKWAYRLHVDEQVLSLSSDFYRDVWDVVRLIPEGRVTSYGAIAKYLGSARSSRMVGWAMNASHAAIEPVPAHRVVNRIGMLSGRHHFPDPNLMQRLLEEEGIAVVNDRVVRFPELFWDPMTELSMD